MALTVISIGEKKTTRRYCLIIIFEGKKNKVLKTIPFWKDIAYFSENGIKNDYSMFKQMRNSLWLTSKFQTNKSDIKHITIEHNYVYLHNKNKEK